MVFATGSAPVNRGSAGLGTPFKARMWEPSTAAWERSRAFALWSLARRTLCGRGHTPASDHSARRRHRSCPSRSRVPAADAPTRSRRAGQTECPGMSAGPGAGSDAPPWAAAARSPPTACRRLPTASAAPHSTPGSSVPECDSTSSKIISLGVLRACRESTRRFDLGLVGAEEPGDVFPCAETGC